MSDPTGGEDLDSFQARLHGAIISTYVLAMLIVPAKIGCRLSLGGWANVRLDDYLSIATLAIANAFFWVVVVGLRPYLGRHVGSDVTVDEVGEFLKYLMAASLTYVSAIAFIKYTILAFYWRLFSVAAQMPIIVLTVSVVAWQIIFLCLCLFSCRPIHASWDLTVTDPQCLNQKSIYLGGSLPNVIVDFILVLMPLPYVWRLHASLYQRMIIAGMLTLGLFICIVSIVRLTIVMAIESTDNVTYNLGDFMLWSTVEINIGLVCACLPSMRHILKMVGLNRLFSSIRGSSSRNTPKAAGNPFNALGGGDGGGQTDASRKASRSGSKVGILSNIKAGFNKMDSDDEGFQMMDSAGHNLAFGTSKSQVKVGRTSLETGGSAGDGSGGDKDVTVISVQRDWSVWHDQRIPAVPQQQS